MQKNKNSTIDLHNIKQDIFLGFLAEQTLNLTAQSYQLSFFGGQPIWLHQPKQNQQVCSSCKINLSFLGQIYCPFDADHCYHRILYFLFCEKCLRQFRCLRQQAQQNWKPLQQIKSSVKKICDAHEIENDAYAKNQLNKLINKTKVQIQEQQAIQQAQSGDEQDIMNEANNEAVQQFSKYDQKQQVQNKQEEKGQLNAKNSENQKKDILFQIYKRVIVQLNNPCVLYTDVALPYNKRILNPQHFCKGCQSKLSLQVQITQRILTLDNNPNSKLLQMDWGSIMIYTCSASCAQSEQECVVVQYEIDAIGDEDIKKLNKHKKNKKKKQKKSKSKSKSKEKKHQNLKDKQSDSSDQQRNQQIKKMETTEQGDWD